MREFYTADHHFGSKNIIKYCDRPFADVDEMTEMLIQLHNEDVKEDDIVWFLGDVVFGGSKYAQNILSRMNGRKIYIRGNHDCWYKNPKIYSAVTKIAGKLINVSHYPYKNDDPLARHQELRLTDDNRWLICGHVHEKWKQQGKTINVGVDVWNYRPVKKEVLANLIQKGPKK